MVKKPVQSKSAKRNAPASPVADKKIVKKANSTSKPVVEDDASDFEDDAIPAVNSDSDSDGLDDDMFYGEGDEGDFAFNEEDFAAFMGEGDEMMLADGSDEDEDEDDENHDLHELLSIEAQPKDKKDKKPKKGKDVDYEDEDEDDEDDEVIANLEFFDPDAERDYHTIKSFVRHLIDAKDFDISGLADIISGQAIVGTVVKSDDAGAEPLGFATCLDYNEHKDAPSIKQLRNFVISNAGNSKNKKSLEALFEKNLGLLIHDRIMNLPMEVVPVLYNELVKDMEYAHGLVKDSWKFENYLLIAKSCDVTGRAAGGQSGAVWYTKFEEEFFHGEASMVRKFPSKTTVAWPGVGKLPANYIVMVIPAQGLNNVVEKLVQVIGINGEEY
jgi:protein BCP1